MASLHPAPAEYYPAPLHEEALARMAYLAGKKSACGLLLGPSGCGKSLLLSLFAKQQRKSGAAVAHISALGLGAGELLREIGVAWGASVAVTDDLPRLWQRTTERLLELTHEQTPALLLVDDLHQALAEGAALVDRCQAQAELSGAGLVVIASCDAQYGDLLTPRFLGRAELRLELDVWTLEETTAFLQQWLTRTGIDEQEFGGEAIEALHDLAQGVPRRVLQLAELALLAGSGAQEGYLSEGIVQSAYDELSVSR